MSPPELEDTFQDLIEARHALAEARSLVARITLRLQKELGVEGCSPAQLFKEYRRVMSRLAEPSE